MNKNILPHKTNFNLLNNHITKYTYLNYNTKNYTDEKRLEEIKDIWSKYEKYYKNNNTIRELLEEFNSNLDANSPRKLTYKKLIEQYKDDYVECIEGLRYDINKAKLTQIKGNVSDADYNPKSKEGREKLKQDVRNEEMNKSKFDTAEFHQLVSDYNQIYSDNQTPDSIRVDFKNNFTDAKFWLKSYLVIANFNEKSGKQKYDKSQVRSIHNDGYKFYQKVKAEYKKYINELDKFEKMNDIYELFDFYQNNHYDTVV